LNLSDDDVSLRRQSLIGQINTVLCRFGRLDPTVKNRLFQAYCFSHYGSELWNLDCDNITEYCSIWRKGLRRIWELPYKFRSDYLSAISGTSPIYDELCRRFLNFITTCNSSDFKLIRSVSGHAIYCARVQSPVGRNYVLCYERYGSKVEDEFTSGIKSSCCGNDISMELSSVDRCLITFAFELVLLKV